MACATGLLLSTMRTAATWVPEQWPQQAPAAGTPCGRGHRPGASLSQVGGGCDVAGTGQVAHTQPAHLRMRSGIRLIAIQSQAYAPLLCLLICAT